MKKNPRNQTAKTVAETISE